MTITLKAEDGTVITPPVTPPAKILVCLSDDAIPGTTRLRIDPFVEGFPEEIEHTAKDPCVEIDIPANCEGLLAENDDSQAVSIV